MKPCVPCLRRSACPPFMYFGRRGFAQAGETLTYQIPFDGALRRATIRPSGVRNHWMAKMFYSLNPDLDRSFVATIKTRPGCYSFPFFFSRSGRSDSFDGFNSSLFHPFSRIIFLSIQWSRAFTSKRTRSPILRYGSFFREAIR